MMQNRMIPAVNIWDHRCAGNSEKSQFPITPKAGSSRNDNTIDIPSPPPSIPNAVGHGIFSPLNQPGNCCAQRSQE